MPIERIIGTNRSWYLLIRDTFLWFPHQKLVVTLGVCACTMARWCTIHGREERRCERGCEWSTPSRVHPRFCRVAGRIAGRRGSTRWSLQPSLHHSRIHIGEKGSLVDDERVLIMKRGRDLAVQYSDGGVVDPLFQSGVVVARCQWGETRNSMGVTVGSRRESGWIHDHDNYEAHGNATIFDMFDVDGFVQRTRVKIVVLFTMFCYGTLVSNGRRRWRALLLWFVTAPSVGFEWKQDVACSFVMICYVTLFSNGSRTWRVSLLWLICYGTLVGLEWKQEVACFFVMICYGTLVSNGFFHFRRNLRQHHHTSRTSSTNKLALIHALAGSNCDGSHMLLLVEILLFLLELETRSIAI